MPCLACSTVSTDCAVGRRNGNTPSVDLGQDYGYDYPRRRCLGHAVMRLTNYPVTSWVVPGMNLRRFIGFSTTTIPLTTHNLWCY